MIHNRMLEKRPDLLALMFEKFDRSRLGEEFGDNANWYSIPIFSEHLGYFASHYSRTFIEAAQLQPGVTKMSAAQWEAIELMHEVADEVAFETHQDPGEIQLLNNHVVFHGRTAYEDYPEPSRRRRQHGTDASPAASLLQDCYRQHWRCSPSKSTTWLNLSGGLLRGKLQFHLGAKAHIVVYEANVNGFELMDDRT